MIRLKNLRKERGISQEELAALFGVERPTISRWENGISEPSLDNLIRLAQFFSVTTDYLLGINKKSSNGFADEVIEKLHSLETNEQKDVLMFIMGILVQKKYTSKAAKKEGIS